MQNLLESAAKKFGVPSEVLDLIGRQFISQIIDEFPSLLLPPIMNTLKQEYVKNGLEWIKQNVLSLQEQFSPSQEAVRPHLDSCLRIKRWTAGSPQRTAFPGERLLHNHRYRHIPASEQKVERGPY